MPCGQDPYHDTPSTIRVLDKETQLYLYSYGVGGGRGGEEVGGSVRSLFLLFKQKEKRKACFSCSSSIELRTSSLITLYHDEIVSIGTIERDRSVHRAIIELNTMFE